MKKLNSSISIFAFFLLFTSCSNDDDTTYYTVTFKTDSETVLSSQKVAEGKTATKPENPSNTDETEEFAGWYAYENLSPESEINKTYTFYSDGEQLYYFDFSTKITKDITLYFHATWNAGYITIDSTDEEEIVLQPGEQGFDQASMLRDEYFLGYDSTLNLYAPISAERFQWYITDPDDISDSKIEFLPAGSENHVTEVTTQVFSLYIENCGLETGTTYKLTLNIWKDDKMYTDSCALIVYQHYEWNQ